MFDIYLNENSIVKFVTSPQAFSRWSILLMFSYHFCRIFERFKRISALLFTTMTQIAKSRHGIIQVACGIENPPTLDHIFVVHSHSAYGWSEDATATINESHFGLFVTYLVEQIIRHFIHCRMKWRISRIFFQFCHVCCHDRSMRKSHWFFPMETARRLIIALINTHSHWLLNFSFSLNYLSDVVWFQDN